MVLPLLSAWQGAILPAVVSLAIAVDYNGVSYSVNVYNSSSFMYASYEYSAGTSLPSSFPSSSVQTGSYIPAVSIRTCTNILSALSSTSSLSAAGSSSSTIASTPDGDESPVTSFSPLSSSTANGAAYSDPYFHGFWNQPFYVHGKPGSVYNILSDAQVAINSRFVFLQQITCPQLTVPAKVHCSSHPGTYFGSLGFSTVNGWGQAAHRSRRCLCGLLARHRQQRVD